jgi:hypothetical protein
MYPWLRSSFTQRDANDLIQRGLLHPGYIVSFAHFHERGFRISASKFFWGLLHYYGIKLQNLNPNSVLQITAFVALCEGYLGINPNFALWRYY